MTPATDAAREARATDYEKAYFERGMFAAYAWMVTKRRGDKLSDAVVDHAWDHRDEGMGPTECLPVRAFTEAASQPREGDGVDVLLRKSRATIAVLVPYDQRDGFTRRLLADLAAALTQRPPEQAGDQS